MANEELISEYIDLSAVTGQTDAMLAQFKRLEEGYLSLSSKSINLGGLSSSKEITAQIKDLQDQLSKLQQQKQQLLTSDIQAAKLAKANADAELAAVKVLQQQRKLAAEEAKKAAQEAYAAEGEKIRLLQQETAAQQKLADAELARADSAKANAGGVGSFTGQTNQTGALPSQAAPIVAVADLTSIEKTAAALNEEKAALAELKVQAKELQIQFDENLISEEQYTKALAENTVAQVESGQVIASFNAELKNLVIISNTAVGSIENQTAQVALLSIEYERLGAAQKASAEGQVLQQKVIAETAALKEEQIALGKTTVNVGNYGSAFDKVGKQLDKFTNLSTIAATTLSRLFRTFVGFAVIGVVIDLVSKLGSVISDTFEKAIAPVGSLADEIKRNADAVAGAQQEYQKAAESVDTLKEHVRLSKEGFIEQDKVVKEYNDTIGKTVGQEKDLAGVEATLIAQGDNYIKFTLYKAAATIALQKAAEAAYKAEQIRQKQASEFTNITDIEGPSASSAASGGDDNAIANYNARQAKLLAAQKANQAKAAKEQDAFNAEQQKIAKELFDKLPKFGFDILPDEKDPKTKETVEKSKDFLAKTSDEYLKFLINLENELSQAQEIGEATRFAFLQDAYAKQKALDEKDRQEKIAIAKLKLDDAVKNADDEFAAQTKGKNNPQQTANALQKNNALVTTATKEFNATISTLNSSFHEHAKVEEAQYQASLREIITSSHAQQVEEDKTANDLAQSVFKEQQDARLKTVADNIKNRNNALSFSQDFDTNRLNKQYAAGLISTEEFQQKKFEIEKEYSLKSQLNQIADAQKIIDDYKSKEVDVNEAETKIADLKKKISDDVTQHLLDNEQKLRDAEKETGKQVVSAIGELVGDGYDKQKNAIQDQIDLLNVQKQKQIDAVGTEIATTQQKANEVALINAKADVQQTALEKKQHDADQKKAAFDKLIAISQIGIATEQTVANLELKAAEATAEGALLAADPKTAAYAGAAYASAAAIQGQVTQAIVQGVLAAALVAAKPIPKYKIGTTNHPGGPFVGGDGGRPEFVLMPSGEGFTTAAHDTLYNAPAGTRVFPDANNLPEDVMRMAHKSARRMPSANDNTAMMFNKMSREIHGLKVALMSRPEEITRLDERGLRKFIQTQYSRTEYINKNV